MNKLFTLCPISDKPEKAGNYVLIHKTGEMGIMTFDGRVWWGMADSVTHYLRPLAPPATAQEAAEKYAEEATGPTAIKYRRNVVQYAKEDFLSGVSWQMAQGWMKIEEGLPEDGQLVMCCSEKGEVNPSQFKTCDNKFWRYPNHINNDRAYAYFYGNVTHWMPLPSPPKP